MICQFLAFCNTFDCDSVYLNEFLIFTNMITRRLSALILGLMTMSLLAGCELEVPINNGNQTEKPVDSQEVTTSVVVTEEDKDSKSIVDDSEVVFNKAKELNTRTVLAKYLDKMIDAVPEYYKSAEDESAEELILEELTFYDVGEIKIAPYAGQKLLAMKVDCDGPCFTVTLSRFAWDEKTGELTHLDNLSTQDYVPDYVAPLMENKDEDFAVKALNPPKTIMLPDGSNSISLTLKDADFHYQDTVDDDSYFVVLGKEAFADPKWGKLYTSEQNTGCLYLQLPDGSISQYGYEPGLTGNHPGHSVTWKDGSDFTWIGDEYVQKTGGCGIMGGCYMVEDIKADQLVEAGKSDQGMKIYLAKDTARTSTSNNVDTKNINIPLQDLNTSYDTYVEMFEYLEEETKPDRIETYEEYLAKRPIIYWQDPFGRYSGLIRSEYRPPAECGKPVIYLYPEKTTEVSVKVGIDEFTVTEPAYNDGWKVIADTQSNILNLADGKTYPYLFWEGKSDKALQLTGGFVVAKAEVESFLIDSLTKLGLNEKESADFRDFWVSKMLASNEPYLLISFVGTTDFNKIAPLDISPAPDTVIRVFMYYQPLWQPISIPGQKLTTKERNGFTVVEWGGTSSDGWQSK